MMKIALFVLFLITLLLLIKYFDKQRDYFNTEPTEKHLDHNSFNEDINFKPMGSTRCPPGHSGGKTLGKRYRGAICSSTFVPKTDEMRSDESAMGKN